MWKKMSVMKTGISFPKHCNFVHLESKELFSKEQVLNFEAWN